jgi:hypothetical protein
MIKISGKKMTFEQIRKALEDIQWWYFTDPDEVRGTDYSNTSDVVDEAMDLSFDVFALVRHIIASGDLTREQVSELEALCRNEDEGDSDNDTPAVKDSSPGEDTDTTSDGDNNTSRTDTRPSLTSGHRVHLRSNYVGRSLGDDLDSLEEMAVQSTIQGKPLGREPWKILMSWFRISQNPFEAPAGRYDDYTWEGALDPDSLLGIVNKMAAMKYTEATQVVVEALNRVSDDHVFALGTERNP